MAKSKSGTTTTKNSVNGENKGAEQFQEKSQHMNGTKSSDFGEYGALIEQAKNWVEENQAAAMLSGFGFGVFIGVLLRR